MIDEISVAGDQLMDEDDVYGVEHPPKVVPAGPSTDGRS
jgi:hypothetical protein